MVTIPHLTPQSIPSHESPQTTAPQELTGTPDPPAGTPDRAWQLAQGALPRYAQAMHLPPALRGPFSVVLVFGILITIAGCSTSNTFSPPTYPARDRWYADKPAPQAGAANPLFFFDRQNTPQAANTSEFYGRQPWPTSPEARTYAQGPTIAATRTTRYDTRYIASDNEPRLYFRDQQRTFTWSTRIR